ncbi:hypothetical protein PHJA_000444200 [Phtheirospermum japonicum]|uniref:Uncharacterized protein n=1 Tax=Phtheirospermum japonicum TaxID=374723 RepID=A0A830BLR4_9LAMI|nr:hypothetical protein PHJA_000444200 [Phtheirospermum japonicum]
MGNCAGTREGFTRVCGQQISTRRGGAHGPASRERESTAILLARSARPCPVRLWSGTM